MVRKTLIEIAHYLVDNSYTIVDVTGEVTEFGRLDEWRRHGLESLQLLAMLRACKAIKDKTCAKEYDRLVKWGAPRVVAITLRELAEAYSGIGRHVMGGFSDDQWIYTNAFTLFLNSDPDEDKRTLQYVNSALPRIWKFFRYYGNSYLTFIHALLSGV
ncbi:hypothetical protein GTO10_04375, partial [Candidatus Saccharibacteria bacterium]|nr:hypothetical protein [Candidatus Saccharibacteria bacterium]